MPPRPKPRIVTCSCGTQRWVSVAELVDQHKTGASDTMLFCEACKQDRPHGLTSATRQAMSRQRYKKPKVAPPPTPQEQRKTCGACGDTYVVGHQMQHLTSCVEWDHFQGITRHQPAEDHHDDSKAGSSSPSSALRVKGSVLLSPGPDGLMRRSVYTSPAIVQLFADHPWCDALLIVVPEACHLDRMCRDDGEATRQEKKERTAGTTSGDSVAMAQRTTITLAPLQSAEQHNKHLNEAQLTRHNLSQLAKVSTDTALLSTGSLSAQLQTACQVVSLALTRATPITLEYPAFVPVYTPQEDLWRDDASIRRAWFHPDTVSVDQANALSLFPQLPGITTTVMYQKITACCPFCLHYEDGAYASINYMYSGHQVWYLISFDDLPVLYERWTQYMADRYQLRAQGWTEPQLQSLCLLLLAKQAMVPWCVLDQVPHTRVLQSPHTVLILRGDVVHFGFSFGGGNEAYSTNMLVPALYQRDARALLYTMTQMVEHWATYSTLPTALRPTLPGAFLAHIPQAIFQALLWEGGASDVLVQALGIACRAQPQAPILQQLVSMWQPGSAFMKKMSQWTADRVQKE